MKEKFHEHVFFSPDEIEVKCPKCESWFVPLDNTCKCGHEYNHEINYKFRKLS